MRKSGYYIIEGVVKDPFRWPSLLVAGLIILYQKTLSPDHGPLKKLFPHGYCRFSPSCSEYGKRAFIKYGLFKGLWLSVWRVLRCNPFNKGGIDEPE